MAVVDEQWWRTVLAGPEGTLQTTASSDSNERYSALPRPSDPRVLVDLDCSPAMEDAVDRMVSSRAPAALAGGIALGVSSLASRRKADWTVSSESELGTLREHLSEVIERRVRISVSVGPPRPNRKPVVRCYAGDELVAVAKLGPDPHTQLMVQNEAHWLGHLMEHPLDGVVTPGLIHSGAYGPSALLVMEPLDLVSDLGVSMSEMPMATLEGFVREHTDSSMVVQKSDWWQSLPKRLGDAQLAELAAHIDAVTCSPFIDELAVSAWHGDWSPWNTGHTVGGQIAIWDWERTSVGVPTGFDLLHLHYQYGSGLDGATLGLAQFGIPTSHHGVLQGLYLLELCARHVEADACKTERHERVLESLKVVLS